jgi:hypothetical protein
MIKQRQDWVSRISKEGYLKVRHISNGNFQKRLISIILSLSLIFIFMPSGTLQAANEITVTCENVTIEQGTNTVDVNVKVSSSDPALPIGTFRIDLVYYTGSGTKIVGTKVTQGNEVAALHEIGFSNPEVELNGKTFARASFATLRESGLVTSDNQTIYTISFNVPVDAQIGDINLAFDKTTSYVKQNDPNQTDYIVTFIDGKITVNAPKVKVSTINVTSDATTITTDGGTLQMNAEVSPTNATDKSFTWSVTNGTGQATIDQTGLLKAVKNGTVTVKATANDGSGVVGTKEIAISNQTIKVTAITVTGKNGATTITTNGGTLQMIANVVPADATNKTVTWSVENGTGSATIDASGLLTATGNGTVTVKATANDGSGIVGQTVITISGQLAPPSAGLTTPFFVLKAGNDTVNTVETPAQNTLSYTAKVPYTVNSITVTPTAATGTIKVNNNVVASGTASADINLNVGINTITITVQDPGCTIKTYTIRVTREQANANNNLASLAIMDGAVPLNPAFAPATTSYTADVADTVTSVTVQPTTADAKATVTVNGTNATEPVTLNPGNNTITVEVTAQSGAKKTYTVVVRRAIQAVTNQNIDVSKATDPVFITVQEGTTGATIDVQPTTQPDNTQATIPENIDVQVQDNTLGNIEFKIPAGTTVTGSVYWNGEITLPVVQLNTSVTVPGAKSVNAVIEIKASDDTPLTFNKAVRIFIPGMAGKSVGFISGGTFTKIDTEMKADTQAEGDKLVKHGKINVGKDVAVWTKHFTKFVAYTKKSSTPTPTPGPGSSGGTTTFTGTTVTAADGGTVRDSSLGAKVEIPANAMSDDFKVKIAKASASGLALPENTIIVGEVVEITKDKSASFSKAVTISLSFDKSKIDLNKYTLSLFWYNTSTKEWVELDNVKVDNETGVVSGQVKHFTKFAILGKSKPAPVKPVTPTTPKVTLTDISGHWAQANIQKLVEAGAISGYPDKTFKPDANITRAEFAVTLVKALKLAPKNGKVFTDTADHWAKDSIATAQAYGIISGYSDTEFGPDDKITREQMAVMITKAANLAAKDNVKTFTDSAKVSAWAEDAVAAASSNGIISGYPDGSFKPQANATRAEAVTVIVKILK